MMEDGKIIGIYHLPIVYSSLLVICLFFVEFNPFATINSRMFLDMTFLSMFGFPFQNWRGKEGNS